MNKQTQGKRSLDLKRLNNLGLLTTHTQTSEEVSGGLSTILYNNYVYACVRTGLVNILVRVIV